MDANVTSISIYAPNGDGSEDAREEVAINIPEDFANSKIKEMLMHHYANKEVSEDIVNGSGEVLVGAGATLTEEDIDRILQDRTVSEISVRNNEIDGIEIEAITENGTEIESLHDRIIGRTLAEDIKDAEGNVLFHINDYITEDMADQIAVMRDKVKIRTVLTCKSKFGIRAALPVRTILPRVCPVLRNCLKPASPSILAFWQKMRERSTLWKKPARNSARSSLQGVLKMKWWSRPTSFRTAPSFLLRKAILWKLAAV